MKPKDFAQQINLNMDNCWGIVRALVDLCMKQEDGKYLLVKDPNKQLLRLYSVPEDAFQVGTVSQWPDPSPAFVTCLKRDSHATLLDCWRWGVESTRYARKIIRQHFPTRLCP